jgi:cysteine desulfurase/selenocysteine lyase
MIENSIEDFPIFNESLRGWSYLDNAATTQRPLSVIQSISNFYTNNNANIHRGLYELSASATRQYESVRSTIKSFLGAAHTNEIAFTSGTTESVNIISNSLVISKGDNIVISAMEHHSNWVPWQQLCARTGATLTVLPLEPSGDISLKTLDNQLSGKTKLIAIAHISNVLGTINNVEEIVLMAHHKNIPVLIDGAQSVGHIPLHVSDLDVDFLVFSAHKMFGPMGTGVLVAKQKHHESIRPLIFGGGAIKTVQTGETQFRDFPYCVEAGTPNVPGVLGLGWAIDYLSTYSLRDIHEHTRQLATQLREKLSALAYVKVIGHPEKLAGIVPFVVEGIHAHDVASFLAEKKIAVRAGHHCAQPLHDQLGLPATVRASFSIYNSVKDVDHLANALVDLKKFWG